MPSRLRILLVDDEEDLRPVLRRMLESFGYLIVEAGDGAGALRILEQEADSIRLVITDIMMPDMDGYELGRQVVSRWPAIPMLYMSGFSNEEAFRHRVLSASTPFIAKPFDGYSLQRKLQALLPHERGTAAPPV